MDPGPGSCRAYTELNDFVGIRDNSGIRCERAGLFSTLLMLFLVVFRAGSDPQGFGV